MMSFYSSKMQVESACWKSWAHAGVCSLHLDRSRLSRSPLVGMHIQKVMQESRLPNDLKMLAHGAEAFESDCELQPKSSPGKASGEPKTGAAP